MINKFNILELILLKDKMSKGFESIPNSKIKRFIVRIPKIDETHLEDTSDIVDYKGTPMRIKKGIIFHNRVDKTDQLVKADGTGIMIINNVTKEQSEILTKMSEELSQVSSKLYVKAFKQFVIECNKLGLIDKYNSDIKYLESNLRNISNSNIYVRIDELIIAYITNEDMIIEGAFGTINGQKVYIGDIILETEEGGFRKIDKEVFKDTYLDINGCKFTDESLDEISKNLQD